VAHGAHGLAPADVLGDAGVAHRVSERNLEQPAPDAALKRRAGKIQGYLESPEGPAEVRVELRPKAFQVLVRSGDDRDAEARGERPQLGRERPLPKIEGETPLDRQPRPERPGTRRAALPGAASSPAPACRSR
jgi:hypothetical protein